MAKVFAPTGIFKKDEKTLTVHWNDGRVSDFPLEFLRSACPCAVCVNEWTGERMQSAGPVPPDVKPTRLFSVGRYAFAVHWSDGHKTGIYSYDYLRKLARET